MRDAREVARSVYGLKLATSAVDPILLDKAAALIEADRRSVLEEAAKACEDTSLKWAMFHSVAPSAAQECADAVRALKGAQERCLYGCAGAEPRVDCVDGNRCECRCHSERRRALLGAGRESE